MQKKNLITFQDVEDTSFFDNEEDSLTVGSFITIFVWAAHAYNIKVLGVKHSCKIKLMQQIVGNCPTNHLAVGI